MRTVVMSCMQTLSPRVCRGIGRSVTFEQGHGGIHSPFTVSAEGGGGAE